MKTMKGCVILDWSSDQGEKTPINDIISTLGKFEYE